MSDEPFSYVNETLEEDRKLTAMEIGEDMGERTDDVHKSVLPLPGMRPLAKAEEFDARAFILERWNDNWPLYRIIEAAYAAGRAAALRQLEEMGQGQIELASELCECQRQLKIMGWLGGGKMDTTYTASEVNAEYHTWMVRKWNPPLNSIELATYNSGGHLRPDVDLNTQYVEALISGPLTESGAIQAAIKRESWA